MNKLLIMGKSFTFFIYIFAHYALIDLPLHLEIEI